MKSHRCFLFLSVLNLGSIGPNLLAAEAAAWPSWRGSSVTGVAAEAQPPLAWSDDKNVKWRTQIPGAGFSTPIVWENQIFLLTAIETDERPTGGIEGESAGGRPKPSNFHEWVVLAIDRSTGKINWQKTARREVPHEGHHPSHGYASGSPVTDGKYLWASFGSRGLYCYDLNGNLKWEKDLGDMTSRMGFGEGASPALAGNLLIVPWDHEGESFIVALDKSTGAEVWRKARDERQTWTTPLIVEAAGKIQAIIPASNRTRSYDVRTGEVIWEAGGLTGNVIPMPVAGHGLAYVMSGFRGFSIQAIKLSSVGDVTETDNIVWHVRRGAPYVPSPVLSGDRLYMTKSNDAYLSCLNAFTGETHYGDQILPGVRGIYASPLAANGYLYIFGRDGTSLVLKDGPEFEVVSTNKLSDKIDASAAMVGKELFIRGHEYLYCITEK